MKRVPILAWIALLAILIALIVTLVATDWLWSLDAVRGLQALGGGLKTPMLFFTFLGDEQFYLIAIPLVYWCLHKELGVDLGVLLVLSSFVNSIIKSFVKHNRPFWEDPKLKLSDATSFSLPSGHAQTSAALFGRLASFVTGSGLKVLWGVFLGWVIVLVALSRVYLGCHYPGDVLWGVAVGLALASLYGWLKPKLLPGLRRLPLVLHVLFGFVAAAVILGTVSGLLVIPFGTGQRFPDLFLDGWGATLEDAATIAGLAWGLWIGLAVESRYVRFTVAGGWWKRALRYLIGVAVLAGIWLGLRAVFPREPLALGLGLRMVRYGLAMLWAILVWPWLFVKLGLGQAGPTDAGPAPGRPLKTPGSAEWVSQA
ncbi:MAG: phosphatase PAP2 family protein [Nitrososphaerales archaeon]